MRTCVYACVSLTTGLMPCAAPHACYIECVHIAGYKYASPWCDPAFDRKLGSMFLGGTKDRAKIETNYLQYEPGRAEGGTAPIVAKRLDTVVPMLKDRRRKCR